MTQDVLDRAIGFATKAHEGQLRKDGAPFILHPLEDAAIVATMTTDREILAAAVLHDTVEDTATTPDDILREFGERVYTLVMHETENKRPEIHPSESWKIRKEESLEELAKSDDKAVLMLWLGDKLSNMRALHRTMERGEPLFRDFNNADPISQKWYYGTILKLLRPLKEQSAYREYETLFHDVFDCYQ